MRTRLADAVTQDRENMARPVQYRKFLLMILLLAGAFAGLGYRLVELHVLDRPRMLAEIEDRTKRTFFKTSVRGKIYDRRMTLLAGSETVKTVFADPSLIGTNQAVIATVARALAPLVKTNEAWLFQRLQPSYFTNDQGAVRPRRYVRLKDKVSMEDWSQIRETMAGLDFGFPTNSLTKSQSKFYKELRAGAIAAEPFDDQLRFYPNGTLAANLLGYVHDQEVRTNGTTFIEPVGVTGVERLLDKALTGTTGWRKTEISRSRELLPYRQQDIGARNGHHAILTIDAGVQHILEAELAEAVKTYSPVSACGVVVRPQTGEIVAMATLPTFDPNNPGSSEPETWRNRVITDIYEPGSTFKIVTVAAAMNEGLISLQSTYDCENGYFWFANRRLKDDHRMRIATVEEIVAKSSNIGTAKIGLQMGRDRVYDYIRAFGFGERTGLGLQGEVVGIVDPPKKWSQLQSSRVPIGHGIAVTPLQMVMAMAAIANGGKLMQPMIVDRLVDDEGRVVFQNEPKVVRQVISESVARKMTVALRRVVSTNGTASRAMLEHYTAAGKTGTAEKPGRGGYIYGKYVASFVGYFPAEDPELCIGIVLDDPKPVYYGGRTAAPVFRLVAERSARYLALKPDISSEAQVASTVRGALDASKSSF